VSLAIHLVDNLLALLSERDVIGWDKSSGQLCLLSSEADLDEEFTLRKVILNEHPRVTVATNLQDAHFYILEKWIVDFLKEKEE